MLNRLQVSDMCEGNPIKTPTYSSLDLNLNLNLNNLNLN